MKKELIFFSVFFSVASLLWAQPDKTKYPDPEFANEVYYLKKDSIPSLVRLEKESSKMESKTKGAGFGGYEMGYELDGEKSKVRLSKRPDLSFVFSSGATTPKSYSPQQDSMLRANGIDPSTVSGSGGMGGMSDPANTISLYKAETAKGSRKILMQKAGGAFGGKKSQSSDKFTFSVRKIRDGYWELVIDKPLPKGEYAFSMLNMGSMDGGTVLYAFAVE